jgi:hypothetical protein
VLGGHARSDVAVMCGSGVTACHHLLAMAHAGCDGAKLFAPSWSGWVDDPARAVAVGETWWADCVPSCALDGAARHWIPAFAGMTGIFLRRPGEGRGPATLLW